MATHSSTLVWRIPWTEEPTVHRVAKIQTWLKQLSTHAHSHPYMATGKTIALTRWIFVSKAMSLFFNMLSRFFIAFLPRSRGLLISWLHSLSTVILEPKEIRSVTVSIVSPSICHEVMGPDAIILGFWMLSFKPVFSTLLFHLYQETL